MGASTSTPLPTEKPEEPERSSPVPRRPAPLSRAPLGAWYGYGNHDYFGGDPEEIRRDLSSVGITTLNNASVALAHGREPFVLGAIDDLMFGRPDWPGLVSSQGAPHLLLAHNPDHFYEAESHGVPLTLSGHTHGGQIEQARARGRDSQI